MLRKFFQVTMLLIVLTLTSLVPASAQGHRHDRGHRRGRRTVFVNNRNPFPGVPRRVRRGFINRRRGDDDRNRRRGHDHDRHDDHDRGHDHGRH
jgi:hypothetical protein